MTDTNFHFDIFSLLMGISANTYVDIKLSIDKKNETTFSILKETVTNDKNNNCTTLLESIKTTYVLQGFEG